MDYLDSLSGYAAALGPRAVPVEVRRRAAWVVADTIAAIVAGAREPELQAMARMMAPTGAANFPGASGPSALLLGIGRSSTADVAALVNGTAGTFLEMDEGNRYSRGHPAVHVLPAVLALCEENGLGHESFLAGFIVGYEIGSRLGAASRLHGSMHPHGTWGTIGAAAGCARALGATQAEMRETINVASSITTATSKRTMLEGGLVRNLYAGLANRNGLLAARLVSCGFTGEKDGPGSLFGGVISDHFDRAAVMADLGSDWHLMSNYFKRHSCCRYNHGTLDAVDLIAARGELPPAEDIERVLVESYSYAAELSDPRPRNTLAAKFSVPFAVATRLVNGTSDLASFTWRAVRDPSVLELAERVSVREDPEMTARLPGERPARVTIVARSGRTVVGEVSVNRGDDAAPYTEAELRDKFLALCSRAWPVTHAEALLKATLALADPQTESAASAPLAEWRRLLARPPTTPSSGTSSSSD